MKKIELPVLFLLVFSSHLIAGPLHDAIRQKQWRVAKEMIDRGADPNEKCNGVTAAGIYMEVLSQELNKFADYYSATIPVQQGSTISLTQEDSVNIINTLFFYAVLLPHLSPLEIMSNGIIRSFLDEQLQQRVRTVLESCRTVLSYTNPQFSMFDLIEKINDSILSKLEEFNIPEEASAQMSLSVVGKISEKLSNLVALVRQIAYKHGFELSDEQILSILLIKLLDLRPLPEEKKILEAHFQSCQSGSGSLLDQAIATVVDSVSLSDNSAHSGEASLLDSQVQALSEPQPENSTAILPSTQAGSGLTVDFIAPSSH